MKLRKRIISIILVAICILNYLPTVNAIAIKNLSLKEDISDAIHDIEYGSTNATYQFEDTILEGVKPGDDVGLVADATYDSLDAGETKVTLTNFRLVGENAADYIIPHIEEPLEKQINITQKLIQISPRKTHIYYGQTKPETTTEIRDYSDQIIKGDIVNVTAEFGIEPGDAIRSNYSIWIKNNTLNCDNSNYMVQLDESIKFDVKEYDPAVTCKEPTKDYDGINEATLTAPDGYLISKENRKASTWSSSININLEETQDGKASYYLRCDDSANNEYYQAISKEKIYNYTSVQTLPTIESITVEKNDENATLNFLKYGVFGNGSVTLTVKAVGTSKEQETTIFLGEEGAYESVKAVPHRMDDGRYCYIAQFTSIVPKNVNVKAYASNSSGVGDKYSILSSTTDGSITVDSKPLALEKTAPVIDSYQFENKYQKIECELSIADLDSGIAKIEYGWDLDERYSDKQKNGKNKLGFRQNGYSDRYINSDYINTTWTKEKTLTLSLNYVDSIWVLENKHKLYLRVTDNAGNTKEYVLQDEDGCDMLAPNISGVEIRKADPLSPVESVVNFLTFGIFYKDSVEIAITADDNEDGDSSYKSGISVVKVNNRTMTKNEDGEYVLTVSPDDIIQGMSIYVEDKVGMNTTKKIMEIPDKEGVIKSNDLMVENDVPSIYISTSTPGHSDNNGKRWYGSGEDLATISIRVAEDKGTVKSGLNSIKVTDNGEVVYEKTGFTSLELEHVKSFTIGQLSPGSHELVVTAIDNAGNTYSETAPIFYIDNTSPKVDKGITITSTNGTVINKEQWFNKDEIISFRVTSIDESSGIKSIAIKINEKEFYFNDDELLSDDDGYYVTVDTTGIKPDYEHKYNATCVVTDFANNKAWFNPISTYVDYENPTISKYTVENSQINKFLHLLPFGTFANDALIFKVYASDVEFDSGVNRVEMNYDGLKTPIVMVNEGNGVFSSLIPIGKEVFENNITVTAVDNYGKKSITCPSIESVKDGSSSNSDFVMIEDIVPSQKLSLPAGDGIERTDGQTWYRSNKPVVFSVQDVNSGIRNIDFTVNGIDIKTDKLGTVLLKKAVTERASASFTEEYKYHFDLNYFSSITKEPVDGKYVLRMQTTDNAGNVKTLEAVYYVDKKKPEINKIDFSPATSDGVKETTDFIQKLEYGYYFKRDFIATIYISDEEASSGLNEVRYRFVPYQDGKKLPETSGVQKIVNGKAKLTVSKGFKGQIFVEASDKVMNSSGEKTTKAYVIDNSAPSINVLNNVVTSYKDAEGNALYVVDNKITVEVTDTVSGIKEIGYSQSGEKNSFTRKTIEVNQVGYKVGDSLGDGWTISEVDVNLVTRVRKTFAFRTDDNNVILTFDATDNTNNKNENVKSDKFTVDKTAPIINIGFRESDNIGLYYSENRIADITVNDRNFDSNLIKVAIENSFGKVPSYSFTKKSITEYVAVINFDEGDYTFDVKGTDLGNHTAIVNYSGGNERLFYVDKTKPELEDNFGTFINTSTNNIFNADKTINIKVKEHNFKPDQQIIRVLRKDAGKEHTENGLVNVTSNVLGNTKWNHSGDIHTISFTLREDAIYQIDFASSDLAGNAADNKKTAVFEIDKTAPIVKAKNGLPVSADNTQFLDVYSYDRLNDPAPTVEFEDLNIDHIKYDLTVYIPENTSPEAETVIKPVKVTLEQDKNKSGTIMGDKFELPNFTKDGVYELKLIAVDKAGNESLMNVNTYARTVDQDVLAYVMDSNIEEQTGLYSFQYENGDTISKRPDNIDDIKVFVLAKKDTGVDIVLRDSDGNILKTNAQSTVDDSIFGMKKYNFTLKGEYFQENFQDDVDMQLQLSVINENSRLDLGKIHIDNIEPTCEMPGEFESWHWYFGEGNRTITVTDISESIDENQCKVFDNGKEIPFLYSSDNDTLVFTLEKGWHNVGIVLSDMAGNTNNIAQKTNIYIGFFWLWVIVAATVTLAGVTLFIIILVRRKKKREIGK